jgi:fibronectin type 3 domain-containing protein
LIVCLAALVALSAAEPCAADTPPAPPEFQDVATLLNGYLDSFNATLNMLWDGTTYPVVFSGTLKAADANAGAQLVNAGYYPAVQLQLQELKAMGVQGIMVAVGFPMLYEPFFSSHEQYQQFVDFYAQVAADVRAAGLKLIVENNNMLSNDVQAGWDTGPFFASLNWDQYQAARAQTAVVVAQTMQPDYLVVLEEPDMEADQTGQTQANTVDGSMSMLSQILNALQQAGVTGVKVGAGVGTWHPQYLQFTQGFVAQPLDFIDTHIYPINGSYLANALTMASVAAAAGKPMAMTEAWMWKIRDTELGVLTADQVRARNSYSFWAPLDTYYLQTLHSLADYTRMAFVAPSGPEYLFAYQDYDAVKSLPAGQVVDQQMQAAATANQQAAYTSTGTSFYSSLVSPPDTAPPATPAGVTGVSGNPNMASVSWTGSPDNVGTAGYYVYRDGQKVATTGQMFYQDSGLTEATTYTYTVEAFDLGGNVSPASLPASVTTLDQTAPTPPANLTATAVSCQQIKLTWAASMDNLGISSYRVFWGHTPTDLNQVGTTAGTTTSFTSYPLTPGTTYYYGVQAVDKYGNVSLMSATASATTPALPSAPTDLTATVVSTKQINLVWAAGPSGMPVTAYRIFRGTSPGGLVQIATRTAPAYAEATLSPATTYYYAVEEVDSGGNVSAMSATVAATTLALPAAPAGLAPSVLSTTRISLTWTSGPSGMTLAAYRVYRGTAPSGLSQVATVKNPAFTDINLTPATTYYYGVAEVDSGGNVSPMSSVVPATTLGLPSAPTNLVATAVSTKAISLTWTSGPSGMPVASYRVFQGTSPSSLSQVATVKNPIYGIATLSPGTTYYYAVQEVDTGGNISPMSATAQATTLAPPSPPANLAGTAPGRTQISLTWTAAQSGMPLASYRVYRGNSPATLAQFKIISATKTSFIDYPVTSGTTYYYALQSADTLGNLSALSEVVAVTTPN